MTTCSVCAANELLSHLLRIEEKLDRLLGERLPVAGQAVTLQREMEVRARAHREPAESTQGRVRRK